jgi:hypothetical protein
MTNSLLPPPQEANVTAIESVMTNKAKSFILAVVAMYRPYQHRITHHIPFFDDEGGRTTG